MAKIMLVDDAAFMRMMVKDALTKAGYTDLIEAQDGAEAVEKSMRRIRIWYLWILPCPTRTAWRL